MLEPEEVGLRLCHKSAIQVVIFVSAQTMAEQVHLCCLWLPSYVGHAFSSDLDPVWPVDFDQSSDLDPVWPVEFDQPSDLDPAWPVVFDKSSDLDPTWPVVFDKSILFQQELFETESVLCSRRHLVESSEEDPAVMSKFVFE